MGKAQRSGSSSSESHSTITRRYWRRTGKPAAWWPWGLLPVIGLIGLFLFGALFMAPEIQAEVRDSVGERLGKAGVDIGSLAADGQRVRARVAADERPDMLLAAVAETTTCDTWAGQLRCPSKVTIERDAFRPAPAAAESAPATVEIRPHRFEVLREVDSVVLLGEVPSAAERERIVDLAGGYFGQFDDRLTVSNETAGEGYAPAADRALALASHLERGQASWSGEALSVSGIAAASGVAAARAEFDEFGASGSLGQFDVQSPDTATGTSASCNEAFTEALSTATIRFRTNSAEIDAGSDELLRELADLAKACPGTLSIEGHTDSRGDAQMNQALSQARAAAVRDALAARGVDGSRMTATGYGETQPIASNESADGRAKNRRISISVDAIE